MPRRILRKVIFAAAFVAGLSACGAVDKYESQVSDWEPVYCYQSLAAVQCYKQPKYSDQLRLVNYYGPHPSRYDAPPPLQEPNFKAPEMINYWVKDAEPIPRPMAKGDLADRPWLTEEGRAEQQALEMRSALQSSDIGTNALLRRISITAPEKITLPTPDADVK